MARNTTNAWQRFETTGQQNSVPENDPYTPPLPPSTTPKWWEQLFQALPGIVDGFKPDPTPSPSPAPMPTPGTTAAQPTNPILSIGILIIFAVIAYYLIKKLL